MKTQNHAARKHSPFSASASPRWLVCPASVSLSQLVPPSPDTKASLTGTASHEKIEKAFLGFRKGEKGWAKGLSTDEKWALDTINFIAQDYTEHFAEERVSLAHLHPEAFGTVDYAFVSPFSEICVVDYKSGKHVVTPRDDDGLPNPQLAYYALGIAHRYEWAFETVRLVIVQPPAHSDKSQPCFFDATFTRAELEKFQVRLKAGIEAAQAKNPPAVITDEGCKFCPAKEICPAKQKQGATAEQRGTSALETLLNMDKKLERLSAAELGEVKAACEDLGVYISTVEAKLLEIAATGKDVTGYRYQARQARRKWIDAELVEAEARKLFGKKAFTENLIGIPALEKLDKDFVAEHTIKESSGFVLKKVGARDSEDFFASI